MQVYNFILPQYLNNTRLDKALNLLMVDTSRNQIQKAIRGNRVTVNNQPAIDMSWKIKEHDVITINLQEVIHKLPQPTAIELDIIYEDEDLMVINKPSGLTVHPGAGNHQDTLVNALLHYTNALSDVGESTRPGIVHRLDKDTSGLMVVAKNNFTHNQLAAQIVERSLVRKYKALIWGRLNPTTGVIHGNIARSRMDRIKMTIVKAGGKYATTYYHTESILLDGLISMVECKLDTGRTHQIRVHLSHVGHSVVGDQLYGHNQRKIAGCPQALHDELLNFKRQALHSWYIEFLHPRTDQCLSFQIALATDIQQLINHLN
ncbi:RluA family pseudouridine synthase [Candidatus Trichorickettsia mobilis]|uniref:RluA family pseudouridine synthase n=1 Tax=Candidatus Trichorickettsia mobilis TaxID=1346319 RepID=UPI002931EBB4|nr:RluA family pseudouridine synthase [Candidatus Trichorickettsia mobilis]